MTKKPVIFAGNDPKNNSVSRYAKFKADEASLLVEPNLNDWVEWANKQDDHDPAVVAFLKARPDVYCRLTPRQWAVVAKHFTVSSLLINLQNAASIFQVIKK